MPGSTGENQENPQLGKLVPRPEFEPAVFCIQSSELSDFYLAQSSDIGVREHATKLP
jgi:hypothetical protein